MLTGDIYIQICNLKDSSTELKTISKFITDDFYRHEILRVASNLDETRKLLEKSFEIGDHDPGDLGDLGDLGDVDDADSDYMNMTLDQIQREHAELLEFNETLDKKYKHHAALAEKYRRKCESIASLFVVSNENHQMTLKAIKTILERVGEE